MKRTVSLALAFCALALPIVLWLLDRRGSLPIIARDRSISTALVVAAALAAGLLLAHSCSRRWLAGVSVIAGLSVGCVALLVIALRAQYSLPPSSPSMHVGEALPDITLLDDSGQQVALATLRDRPTVLIWFRGSWCPYCRRQLVQFSAAVPDYLGSVRVLGVTADSLELVRELRRDLNLPFSVLSDPERSLTKRCEVSHCVAIADREGVIRWGVVSGNWDNLSPKALLQSAFERR